MSAFKRILGSIRACSELHGLLSRSEARRVMIVPRLPKPPGKRGAGGARGGSRLGRLPTAAWLIMARSLFLPLSLKFQL